MFSKISDRFRDLLKNTDESNVGTHSRKRKLNVDLTEAGQSPAKRHKPDVLCSRFEDKPLTRRMADWVVNTRKTFAENYFFKRIINSPKDFYHSVTGTTNRGASKPESPLCAPQFSHRPNQQQQQPLPFLQPPVVPYAQQMAYQGQNLERRDLSPQGQCAPRGPFAQGYNFPKSSLDGARQDAFSFARTKDSMTFNAPQPSAMSHTSRYPATSSSSMRPVNGRGPGKPKSMYEKMYKPSNIRDGIKLRNQLAAKESIRIEEKDSYAKLLQQFISRPIPWTSSFGNSQLHRSSIQTTRQSGDSWLESKHSNQGASSQEVEKLRAGSYYGDSSQANLSTTRVQVEPRRSLIKNTTRSSVVDLTEPSEAKPVVIDLTADVSAIRKPADLSERSFLDIQALRRKKQDLSQRTESFQTRPTENLFAQSTPVTTRTRLSSPTDKSTPTPPMFDDAISPTQREFTIPPIPSSPAEELLRKSLSESKYAHDDWITDIKSKYSTERRRKDRLIKEEEVKCSFHREKRDEFEGQVEEHLRQKLSLIEREPPVLEQITITEEEQSTEFIALTEEEEALVDNALTTGPGTQILSDGFKQQIRRCDMATLAGLNWLNDEIINFYMNMLMERGEREGFPTVHAFNTFFYQKLISAGHSGVRRWTRRIDIFAMDYIIVPVHLGMHWCLAIVDFRKKEIRYYDSMGSNNDQCLNALKQYLEDESMDKKKQPYSTSDWKVMNMKNIPQQMNGSDCGMFACKFAEYISRDADITFTQEHMPYFRRRMVLEILQKQFMGEKNEQKHG